MTYKIFIPLLVLLFALTNHVGAQNVSEAKQRYRDRVDCSNFKRQISELKEFAEERKKCSKLQKEHHEPVKVIAVVDTNGGSGDDEKVLTGYITQQIGENSTNVYELTYDRAAKKILTLKKTGDGEDPEAVEKPEKQTTTHAKAKKSKDDEDDDTDDEDKPEKGKKKDKDDE